MAAPLTGIRVLEAANWLAAPAAAGLMGDLGADVVKVEPPGGDAFRNVLETSQPGAMLHAAWENDNRSKRGIAIDLEVEAGRALLQRLVRDADVFITNFTRQRVQRYEVGFERLRALNPQLVYVQFSGYGSRGPDADRPGFDFLAFWARSGIEASIGEASAPPIQPLGGQGDHTTSLNILAATLAALRLRDATGEAQRVEVTLQQTGLWTISNQVQTALLDGLQPPKVDRRAPRSPIANTYPTRDGRWVQLTMPHALRDWPAFARAIGEPGWIVEYDTFERLTEHAAELAAAIEQRFLERDLAEWAPRLDAEGLLWAPVATLPEVIADPQLAAMETFEEVAHPRAGALRMMRVPFRIDGAEVGVRRSAPGVGEHTFEVLSEAGLTAEEIAELAAQRVFG
jgi:crotonobetainyl-CoA:carnitine CoA-transferase CaiB-like acyl-CoA transferase